MNTLDSKQICAKEALQLIQPNTVIGLGGGTTISHLIHFLKERNDLHVKVVTPSFTTKLLCQQNGLQVLPTSSISEVAIAFDGCDEADEQFFALKSGGGIHTNEKLIASMAKDYILLIDDTKLVKSLTFTHPVVLEVLVDSLAFVMHRVSLLGGKPSIRMSKTKDGATITDDGNVLIDVFFEKVEDIKALQSSLKNITGVIETSLFTEEVTKLVVTSADGTNILSKNEVFK